MATRNGTLCQKCGSTTNSLESTDGGLRGAVAPNDHKSYTRLGKILGLGNKQAVKEWMDSKAFKPAFQRLYDNWIVVQDAASQAGKYRKRGPDLRAVVDAIEDPHAVAEMRYISPMGVDSSEFYEIDHYALCLVALRASNKVRANGLFRGKTCSQKEMDQRLWQAILRATMDMTVHRRNKGKLSTYEMRYGKSSTNPSKGSGSAHLQNPQNLEDGESEESNKGGNDPLAIEYPARPEGEGPLPSKDIKASDDELLKF